MLPIKKLSLLEPVLLQGKITWSTATLYSIQSMLNSLENGRCSFIFTSLVVHTTPIISTKNTFLYFSQFSSPYSTLTCSQNHPYKPTNTPFLYISAIFHLPFFAYNHLHFLPPHPFSQLRVRQGTMEPGSLVRTGTVLISLLFRKM